jgi:hypothetical protein
LGVGKNMVAAIRYWLTATKVIDNGSITEFGEFLNQKDIYLEDDASCLPIVKVLLIHFF